MIAYAFALLAQASPVMAEPKVDCENPVTQSAMNICSYREYLAADAAMSDAWKAAKTRAREGDASLARNGIPVRELANLLDAQRKWLAFRDAHCLSIAGPRDEFSGTIWPLIFNGCMNELTETRTSQLHRLGTPEG